jgi:hypothetical protein
VPRPVEFRFEDIPAFNEFLCSADCVVDLRNVFTMIELL